MNEWTSDQNDDSSQISILLQRSEDAEDAISTRFQLDFFLQIFGTLLLNQWSPAEVDFEAVSGAT